MDEPNPGNLIERCRVGDERAWGELVDRYAGLVYAIARKSGLDESACDDVAQHVFSALLRSLGSITQPEALPGWLATSARRAAWKASKARRLGGVQIVTERAAAQEEGPVGVVERRHALLAALEAIDARCRELLRILFWSDPSPAYSDVAAKLGIPVGAIGPTRRRCLEKLKGALGEFGTRE